MEQIMIKFKKNLLQKVNNRILSYDYLLSFFFIDSIPNHENDHSMMIVENHNDKEDEQEIEDDENINGIDSTNELVEAQKQLVLLRENIDETNGN